MICKHYIRIEDQPGMCDLREPISSKSTAIYKSWTTTVENSGGNVGGINGVNCGRGICCFAMTSKYSSQIDCPEYETEP